MRIHLNIARANVPQLSSLSNHPFPQALIADGEHAFKGISFDAKAISLPKDLELDEYQFYLHNVGFYLFHTLAWCKQLDLAIEFLSVFDYSKRLTATRADHLIFNIENYIIRLTSVHDRALQLVNAVFHLCINEEHVAHGLVISNYKVVHRPEIVAKIKAVKRCLDEYAQSRHTLIHKHSFLDVDLKKVERLYMTDLSRSKASKEQVKNLQSFRARYLGNFIQKKKTEFTAINSKLSTHMEALLTALQGEYERQKEKLA